MSPRISPFARLSGTLGALAIAVLVSTILMGFLGGPGALKAFFAGPFGSRLAVGQWLDEASLLTLTGLAASLSFTAGSFNLGGEGQIYTGALACTASALLLPPAAGLWGIIASLTAGIAVGAALGGISGWLRARWGADELITTFLLSAAALPLVDSFVTTGPLTDKASFLITTKVVPSAFWLPALLFPSPLSAGALLVVPLAAATTYFLFGTRWGYRWRMTGQNRRFAEYAGIAVSRYGIIPLAASGGLHGLTGGLGVLGGQHALVQSFSFGWGWNGIAVALIARNHPLAVVVAALFFSYLDQAARWTVLLGQFPFQLSALFQAFLLFFVTANLVRKRRTSKTGGPL